MAGPRSSRTPRQDVQTDLGKSSFYDYEDLQDLAAPNLANEIHPVFRKENFKNGSAYRFDYPALQTTLKLASRFLERALPVFYTILCCEPRRESESINALPPPPAHLTKKQQAEVRAMLLRLAEVVTYRLAHMDIGAGTQVDVVCEDVTVPGHGSLILINQELHSAVVKSRHDDDPVARLFHEFNLARVFVHELAHAAENASAWSHTYPTATTFLNRTTELGLETEAFLFGGAMGKNVRNRTFYSHEGVPSKLPGILVMYEWPSPKFVKSYSKEHKLTIPPIRVRGEPPIGEIYLMWRVSLLWLANLFQEEFWQEGGSLKVGRETGYRFDARVRETLRSVGAEDQVSAVPVGCEVTEMGAVKRRFAGDGRDKRARAVVGSERVELETEVNALVMEAMQM